MERRVYGTEVRAEGRRLSGIVLAYGDVSPSHRERFEPGALRLADAVHLDLHHDPERAVAWHPGGGLQLRQTRRALTMTADLPPIPAADRALAEVRGATATGLSVEFKALVERRDGNLRVIQDAVLSGIGLVRAPSYEQSYVEARRRSGRTLRAIIPADVSVECRCSGAQCRFAKMAKEGLQEAFDKAFRQFEHEVVAGFGSYSDSPLASAGSRTLRGKILSNGDGALEIDLPDSAVGAATIAAHEAAGLVVRPHIDSDAAVSTVEGETRIYQSMPIRGILVSATDARQGWPPPVLVPTPDELASAGAPRERRLARWL